MNVMIIHPSFELYGGAEHLVVKLCNHLASKDIDNTIVTTSINQDVINDLNDTNVIQVPVNSTAKFTIQHHVNVANALRFKILKTENQFDIINVHNFPGELAVRGVRKPVVWMCNDPPHCSLDNSALSKIFLKTEKYIVDNNIDDVVVADEYNKNRFGKLYGFDAHVIPYGIDCNSFSIEKIKHDTFNIIQVGNITPFKNQMESLKAIKSLKEMIPSIRLTLVGDDSSEYAKECEHYVTMNKLSHNVKFTGNLSRSEVNEQYQLADLAVFPGKQQGGWLSPFEAMCAKVPVIVSKELPCSSIISNEGIGIVTDNIQLTIYNAYISQYLDRINLAYDFVKHNLTWEQYGDNMIKQFEETINYGSE